MQGLCRRVTGQGIENPPWPLISVNDHQQVTSPLRLVPHLQNAGGGGSPPKACKAPFSSDVGLWLFCAGLNWHWGGLQLWGGSWEKAGRSISAKAWWRSPQWVAVLGVREEKHGRKHA